MAVFNIDGDAVFSGIQAALEAQGQKLTGDQIAHIVSTVEASLPGITYGLLEEAYEEWRQEAIDSGGWGTKYVAAIKMKAEPNGDGSVYLDETVMDKGSNKPSFMFAKMVEEGVKSWSIKDALLASDKAKVGPAGIKYIVVPFPVATPSAGKGGAKLASKFGGRKMTQDMHKLVKAGEKVPAGSTVSVTNTQRTYEVDVSGLTRYNTRQLHSQYGIFRCVSERSKGWQYPDKSATPVFPSVAAYVEKRIHEELDAFCREIVKEFSV